MIFSQQRAETSRATRRQMYPTGLSYLGKGRRAAGDDRGRLFRRDRQDRPAIGRASEGGAEAIMLMGTSLSFYNEAAAFNRELE